MAVVSSSFVQNFTPTLQYSGKTYAVVTEEKPLPPKQPKGRGEGRRNLNFLHTEQLST